ncbi:MAG: hypothetical protein GXP45_07625 [bacterium]|nr:hypothetical protein [bacterium]
MKIDRIFALSRTKMNPENDAKMVRFSLQLSNKLNNYLVNKMVLIREKNLSEALQAHDVLGGIAKDLKKIRKAKDFKMFHRMVESKANLDKIRHKQFRYNTSKFLSLHIASAHEEDFFYDVINSCAELNHPIYKWKTEFEAGMKFYVNAYSHIMPLQMSEYIKKAVFEKLMDISDEIYQKFIFADYDRSQLVSKYDLQNYALFFDMDEHEMKTLITKKVIDEFLRSNKFIESIEKKPLGERDIVDEYVMDVKDYLKFLLTR